MTSDNDSLNFPYYVYPGLPGVHGYYDVAAYNIHLLRLFNDIQNMILNLKEGTHLHITIGTAAEEQIMNKSLDSQYEFQYQQLYPIHLVKKFNETQDDIIHLIISPNKIAEPSFIAKTPLMGWVALNDYTFVDKTNRYKIMIYNTMMPTCDPRNKSLIDYYRSRKLDDYFNLDSIIQTDNDIRFVNKFYAKLNELFDVITERNGSVSCFSFAVFNEYTNRSHLKNYVMFKEIMSLFDTTKSSVKILAEWRYIMASYAVTIYGTNNVIKYAEII